MYYIGTGEGTWKTRTSNIQKNLKYATGSGSTHEYRARHHITELFDLVRLLENQLSSFLKVCFAGQLFV